MNSISSSEDSNLSPIDLLSVKDLNVVYNISFYRDISIRKRFISLMDNPLDTILGSKDRLHAVKNLNFSVKKGERLGILGPNGSGKTSLCRCLAEIIVPTSGKILRRGIMRSVFESTLCFLPELTGEENARILARLIYKNEKTEVIEDIVKDSLEFSGIGKFKHTSFLNYSMGMKTRLCLSLVSARPCDLLILDEVFNGADIFFQKKMSHRVLDLIHNSGAVLLVSHSLKHIKQACNRVIVISKGEIVFDGDVDKGVAFYEQMKPEES